MAATDSSPSRIPFFKSLHIRILVPFALLFFLFSFATVLATRHYQARIVESRIVAQADRLSQVLSRSEFVFNPVYLDRLKDVIDSDLIVFDAANQPVISTLPENTTSAFTRAVNPEKLVFEGSGPSPSAIRQTVTVGGRLFTAIARPLHVPSQPGVSMVLCVFSSLQDVETVGSETTRMLILVSAAGLFAAGLIGYAVVRAITGPIMEFMAVTSDISSGDFDRTVPPPAISEFRELAGAVNRMSRRLRDYEKQVAESSRLAAAGKVTAAMAHEIRNPLSSIKMMTQLLRNQAGSETDKTMILSLLEEVSRIERIVNDATRRMKPAEITRTTQDIRAAIEEILPVIAPKLNHRHIALKTEMTPGLPDVSIDKDRIKQVLWNLLINAMENMPRGGAVTVRTGFDEAANRVEIRIDDEGEGLPDMDMENLFSEFFTTKPEGLGLGLFTSREIIERHGGAIKLENLPGGGARATVSLPAAPGNSFDRYHQ